MRQATAAACVVSSVVCRVCGAAGAQCVQCANVQRAIGGSEKRAWATSRSGGQDGPRSLLSVGSYTVQCTAGRGRQANGTAGLTQRWGNAQGEPLKV